MPNWGKPKVKHNQDKTHSQCHGLFWFASVCIFVLVASLYRRHFCSRLSSGSKRERSRKAWLGVIAFKSFPVFNRIESVLRSLKSFKLDLPCSDCLAFNVASWSPREALQFWAPWSHCYPASMYRLLVTHASYTCSWHVVFQERSMRVNWSFKWTQLCTSRPGRAFWRRDRAVFGPWHHKKPCCMTFRYVQDFSLSTFCGISEAASYLGGSPSFVVTTLCHTALATPATLLSPSAATMPSFTSACGKV